MHITGASFPLIVAILASLGQTAHGQNFTISPSPNQISVLPPGSTATVTITTAVSGGFNAPITLSYSLVNVSGELPAGVTVQFGRNPIPAPGSGTSTVTIQAASTATIGTFDIKITGTGGSKTNTALISVTVQIACAAPGPSATYNCYSIYGGPGTPTPSQPFGKLVQGWDGNLYGTSNIGSTGAGTIFSFNPQTNIVSTIYSFTGGALDGGFPYAGLSPCVFEGDCFYGTTAIGGENGGGTVFVITLPGNKPLAMYSFCTNCADGSNPHGGVVLDQVSGKILFGTTLAGGNGSGTVFALSTAAHPSLISYPLANPDANGFYDGSLPWGDLLPYIYQVPPTSPPQSVYYGTAEQGGANEAGTVFGFALNSAGAPLFTPISSFCNDTAGCEAQDPGGADPYAGLTSDSSGLLWGTTFQGNDYETGPSVGTVYQFNPGAHSGQASVTIEFPLSSVGNGDGYPRGPLVLGSDGNFYGINTGYAGGGVTANDVYSFNPSSLKPATTVKVWHNFCPLPYVLADCAGADGNSPWAGLVQHTNGMFYGVTVDGGNYGNGTVFSLSTGAPPFVSLQPRVGQVGSGVTILGTNLSEPCTVTFNGVPATSCTVNSTNSAITTTVPTGATTGTVQVSLPSRATLTSNTSFRVY